ncbi:hypothetical protein AKJ40_01665 [candidate division MSBL1 archaeon SCGC-AAA259M10]|uniref:Uncharacterized protein n=1 Tax=candidate division MSBL1 archaeon SCGC-AAA259M10 TaxID=1698270 RepID=A0A133V1A6_9EURY|nr:hypothetical protein AKJ40_01665 [candidate division MSBL1 archaeon SCGC-AAA259M10]
MVRGQTIDSPFDGGIPARIYFAAYLQPRTGYQLAKEVFGTREGSEQPKTPSKIYKYIKQFPDFFYKEYPDDSERKYKIHASLEPLLDQLPDSVLEIGSGETVQFVKRYLKREVRETLNEGYRADYWRGIHREEDPELSEEPDVEILSVFLEYLKYASAAKIAVSEIGLDQNSEVGEKEAARWALKEFLSPYLADETEKVLEWIDPLLELIGATEILNTPSLSGRPLGEAYPQGEKILDLTEFTYLVRQKMRSGVDRKARKQIKRKEEELKSVFRKGVERAIRS